MSTTRFNLNSDFFANFQGKQPKWGPLGYFTFKRTYARPIVGDESRTEEFYDTCKRVVEGVYTVQKKHCTSLGLPWDDDKAQNSAQNMFTRMWDFKWLPPGRGLWVMGTDIVDRKGGAALNNCGFVSTANLAVDFAGPFCFLMDMSMLGVGIGADTEGAGKVVIQQPTISEEPFVVEDSREGWTQAVGTILNSYVGIGYQPRKFDLSKLRPKGTPLKGFGGVSSGPGPLERLLADIKVILDPCIGKPIGSTQIVDLFNTIGVCVVSGGIRRTAEIMFGQPGDQEFSRIKDPAELNALYSEMGKLQQEAEQHARDIHSLRYMELTSKLIPEVQSKINNHPLIKHRWASNNSIFATVGMDYTEVAKQIATNGEPGLVWLDTMQKYSRLKDPIDNKDHRVQGSNPCSEQSLESYELCCLVETFPANHETIEDWIETLKYAYLYAKTVTLIPTHYARTNSVTLRNRRIGCSQSGIIQAVNKFGRHSYLQACNAGYSFIQRLDNVYSEWLCVPRSIKTTSVKPSGTVSLLCGATPGIHYPHSEYYIRNIRVDDTSSLLPAARAAGYPVEPCSYAPNTWVVSFPIHEQNFKDCKDDVTIWQQFANAADLQYYWADNQVSVTVTFRKEEAKDIANCLSHFDRSLKSVSLLPLTDHAYVQAPYITIDKAKYEDICSKITGDIATSLNHEAEDKFCDGDKCLV